MKIRFHIHRYAILMGEREEINVTDWPEDVYDIRDAEDFVREAIHGDPRRITRGIVTIEPDGDGWYRIKNYELETEE
jgi:hypothetical protein